MAKEKEINILLVEDTEEHAQLIGRMLQDGRLRHRLFLVRDGETALDFLFNRGDYADEREYPRPDVILLDLRLPGLSGIEVLEQIKKEEKLKDIPVAVLTVSDEDEDILRSYQAGARSYLLKSVGLIPKAAEGQRILDAIVSLVR
jgi:CheY-like chemotaxis protein